jgi:hypothetical protein
MRIAILIDGGHLRILVRSAGYIYDPDFIEKGGAHVRQGRWGPLALWIGALALVAIAVRLMLGTG